MRKLSVKKLLVLFILIAVVALFTTSVQATGAINPLNLQTPSSTTTTNTVKPTNTVTPTNTVATANTAGSTYQNTNLPQTGDASDYAIFTIIALSIVVAIYGYRKYVHYNI